MENFQEQFDKAIKDYATTNQYGVSLIPSHLHNGMDTNRINQTDIIPIPGYTSFFTENVSETFLLQNVPNVTRLEFSGFAANNNIAPATKRAIVNGKVYFGKYYTYSGSGTIISVSATNNQAFQILNSGNSMYVDSTNLANNKVSATTGIFNPATGDNGFVTVVDETGSIVASMGVSSYAGNTITIVTHVATNWKIQGLLTLT